MPKNGTSMGEFISYMNEFYPNRDRFTRAEINRVKDIVKCSIPVKVWKYKDTSSRPIKFILTLNDEDSIIENVVKEEEKVTNETSNIINLDVINDTYKKFIPIKNDLFVGYGYNYKIIDTIVKNREFFPVYVWGVSGVGKTMQIEQCCAINERPYFRCQITKDTTNEDLIGSYSLKDGNTVWVDGPVLNAYKSGGVLLLDEIDLNSSLMILQVVLENKPVYVPQTNDLVYPKEGFTVFATGNTKGDGGDDRFVGTSVLNDAFLERFVLIIEQKIPTIEQERNIIEKYITTKSIKINEELLESFIEWIKLIRDGYKNGDFDVYISSRRIQYILKMFKMTGNFNKSLEYVLSRYQDDVSDAFIKTWKAIYNN